MLPFKSAVEHIEAWRLVAALAFLFAILIMGWQLVEKEQKLQDVIAAEKIEDEKAEVQRQKLIDQYNSLLAWLNEGGITPPGEFRPLNAAGDRIASTRSPTIRVNPSFSSRNSTPSGGSSSGRGPTAGRGSSNPPPNSNGSNDVVEDTAKQLDKTAKDTAKQLDKTAKDTADTAEDAVRDTSDVVDDVTKGILP